jgi:hypothetical protein
LRLPPSVPQSAARSAADVLSCQLIFIWRSDASYHGLNRRQDESSLSFNVKQALVERLF